MISCEAGPNDLPAIELEPESTFHPGVASDPELLILGIEEIDLGTARESATDDLLNALGALMHKKVR